MGKQARRGEGTGPESPSVLAAAPAKGHQLIQFSWATCLLSAYYVPGSGPLVCPIPTSLPKELQRPATVPGSNTARAWRLMQGAGMYELHALPHPETVSSLWPFQTDSPRAVMVRCTSGAALPFRHLCHMY